MSRRRNKQAITVTLQHEEVCVVLMLLNERRKKLERQALATEASGERVHPVAIKTLRRARSAKQRIEAALTRPTNSPIGAISAACPGATT